MAEEEVMETLWNAYPSVGYADFNADSEGSWRLVNEGNKPIAIIWTDNQKGAGIVWIEDTEEVKQIFKYFAILAMKGESASTAYNIMDRLVKADYGDPTGGKLSEVAKLFETLGK